MKELLTRIFEAVGTTQANAGMVIGRNKKLMNDRLVRGTLRYKEFITILDGIGVELTYINRKTKEVVKPENGRHLEALIEHSGWEIEQVAKIINKTATKFKQRIACGNFRASEFLKIVEGMGYKPKYTIVKTNNVISFKPRPMAHGRAVSCMVNGVIYSTSQSTALANDFYSDGEHEYNEGRATELYINKDNKYFFVDYTEFEGVKDRVIPITAEVARAFIKKHGRLK